MSITKSIKILSNQAKLMRRDKSYTLPSTSVYVYNMLRVTYHRTGLQSLYRIIWFFIIIIYKYRYMKFYDLIIQLFAIFYNLSYYLVDISQLHSNIFLTLFYDNIIC